MAPLNGNHLRRLEAILAYVDSLLQRAEHLAAGAFTPFEPERPDVAPEDAARLAEVIATMRARMLEASKALGLPPHEEGMSARRSIGIAIEYARVALEDLAPRALRGYGPVDDDVVPVLSAMTAELSEILARAAAILRPGP